MEYPKFLRQQSCADRA